ncbi:transmembrane anchor protein [Aromatoleum bremense]|uniref:Transmembrane anchor protein n=1 Tax=Aromatoleum bremense TaxID=76115 RepID=A0ABX1NSZ8_9RHOO|nr:transmembrane anchor protein [Aromatoleum bremense]NMG15118.1 transmembrane anchor protein [Aromatoleum bremense]QTQ31486.1 Uncharacterized protein pbN1_14940 [Aromatoleum bremense]
MYNTDLPTRAELPGTGKLLRSTAIAALIATGLLITTILPAEYGIDPTGAGRALGLTQMGEIKISLASEANAGEAAPAGGVAPTVSSPPRAAIAVATAPAPHGHEHEHSAAAAPVVTSRSEPAAAEVVPARQHTVTISLKPGKAAEVKLTMQKDASVRYEWSTVGGAVNYDTHGDPVKAPKGFYHGYSKGKNETANAGTLQAAFDGKHGWFWRNRSAAEVTVTLKTSGDYAQIERVL